MKRVVSFIVVMAMFLSLMNICSFAEETTADFGYVSGDREIPVKYHNDGTVAVRFKANGVFHKITFKSATWGNTSGCFMDIDLYEFDTDYATSVAGNKVAAVYGFEMTDNAWNGGDFGKDIAAGEYVAVIAFRGETCGLYTYLYEGANPTMAFYRNGDIVPGTTLHGTIYYSDGTNTVGNITNSGEIPSEPVSVPLLDNKGGVGTWIRGPVGTYQAVAVNVLSTFCGFDIPSLWASNPEADGHTYFDMLVEVFHFNETLDKSINGTPVYEETRRYEGDSEEGDSYIFDDPLSAGKYVIKFTQQLANGTGGLSSYFVLPSADAEPLYDGDTVIYSGDKFNLNLKLRWKEDEKYLGVTSDLGFISLTGSSDGTPANAHQLNGDGPVGIMVDVPEGRVIAGISGQCPTWSMSNTSIIANAYPWTGSYSDTVAGQSVATASVTGYSESQLWATLYFDKPVTQGTYLILFENGNENTVGFWNAKSRTDRIIKVYKNGIESDTFTPVIKIDYEKPPVLMDSISVNVGADMHINVRISDLSGYSDYTIGFASNDSEETIVTADESGVFTFEGLDLDEMDEEFTITLYDGDNNAIDVVEGWSVKDYLLVDLAEDPEYSELAANVARLGSEIDKYFGGEGWAVSEDASEIGEKADYVPAASVISNGEADKFTSAQLYIDDNISIRFNYETENAAKIVITSGADSTVITDLEAGYVMTEDISVTELAKSFTVTMYGNAENVLAGVTYSVQNYIYNKFDATGSAYNGIVKALAAFLPIVG